MFYITDNFKSLLLYIQLHLITFSKHRTGILCVADKRSTCSFEGARPLLSMHCALPLTLVGVNYAFHI